MLSSLFLIAQVAVSQGAPFALAPESKIWIEGDSSVHPWSCKATKFTAGISADPAAEQPAQPAMPWMAPRRMPVPPLQARPALQK